MTETAAECIIAGAAAATSKGRRMKRFSSVLGSSSPEEQVLATVQGHLAGSVDTRQALLLVIQRAALRTAMATVWRDRVIQLGLGKTAATIADRLAEAAALSDDDMLVATGSLMGWAERSEIDRGTIGSWISKLEHKDIDLIRVLRHGEGRHGGWRIQLLLDNLSLARAHQDAAAITHEMLAAGERFQQKNPQLTPNI